jgi:hypothetical protein
LRGGIVAAPVAGGAALHHPVDSGEADVTMIQGRAAAAVAPRSNSRRGKGRQRA